jgi:hypothetical protein
MSVQTRISELPSATSTKSIAPLILIVWLCLLSLTAAAVLALRAPAPVTSAAPAQDFSAERALDHVRIISRAPHPTGSIADGVVAEYLLARLSTLGLQSQTFEAVGIHSTGNNLVAGNMRDIVGRLRGTGRSSRAIMLMAHYDSVDLGDGAADDGSGVAAILETIRAIKAGPALQNDVIVLFTDGEEAGLLGAEAFANSHPWIKDVGVIINFEARGNKGPSLLFETGANNRPVIEAVGHAAPYPIGSSLFYDLYHLLPNDTDFTVFRSSEIPGLNFAFGSGLEAYHTSIDVPDNLSLASLQHHGSYALALSRYFGNMELAHLKEPAGDDVFFDWFGSHFIAYSKSWVMPAQIAVTLLLIVAVLLSVRRSDIRIKTLLLALLSCLAFLILIPAVLSLVHMLVARILSGRLIIGDCTANSLLLIGYIFLSACAASFLFRWINTKCSISEFSLASLIVLCVASWAMAIAFPSGSYLFFYPLLLLVIGRLLSKKGEARTQFAASLPGISVAVLLFAPIIYLLYIFLTLQLITIVAVGLLLGIFFIISAYLLPAAAFTGRAWQFITLFLLACGVANLVAGSGLSGHSAAHPTSDTMLYSLNTNDGAAAWISYDQSPDEWTRQFFSNRAPQRQPMPDHLGGIQRAVLSGAAPAADLLPPIAELKSDNKEGDLRKIELTVKSQRAARVIYLRFASGIQPVSIKVATRDIAVHKAPGPLRISLIAVPVAGITLQLTLKAPSGISFWVMDQSPGFPVPTRPRPDRFITAEGSDVTMVCKRYTL